MIELEVILGSFLNSMGIPGPESSSVSQVGLGPTSPSDVIAVTRTFKGPHVLTPLLIMSSIMS